MAVCVRRFASAFVLVSIFACVAAAAERYPVFKSTDRGRSWVRSHTGIPDRSRINAFGSLNSMLFAGTDAGIFSSANEAQSWQPATGLAMSSGRVISLASLGPNMFAGTDGKGLLMSSDNGKSWIRNAAFPSSKVRSLLAHEGTLYAGTDAEGVFASQDGGRAWTPLGMGLPPHAQVFALSIVKDKLFAGLYSKGLYTWKEPERRWAKVGPVTPLVLAAIGDTLVAGHNPGGIYWSADGGASWSKGRAVPVGQFTPGLLGDFGELSSDAPVWEAAADHELVFAGASSGIYYSEDRGRTWTRARAGLPAHSPGVAFLLKPNFILAATVINRALPNETTD